MLLFLLGSLAALNGAPQKVRYLDGIAALVGKRVILSSEIKLKLTPQLKSICGHPNPAARKRAIEGLWKGAIEDEIGHVLMEVEAEKHNIYIGSTQINATIELVMKNNSYTSLSQLKAALAQKHYPYLLWRKDLRRHLLRRQLLADLVRSKINVDEAAVKSYYLQKLREGDAEEKVTLLELFLPNKSATPKRLNTITAALKKGTDLTFVGKRYAPGKAIVQREGITPGTYAPQVDRILFPKSAKAKRAPLGSVHGPIKTAEGYFFVKILSRIESGYLAFEKVKEKLKRELMNRKILKKTEEWIKTLRSKYLVDVRSTVPPPGYLCH